MHRNCLIFSSACLLVSMPDVGLNVDVKSLFFEGKVGPIGAALLAHGLFLATLYCFGIFSFEWQSLVRPILTESVSGFEDLARLDRGYITSIEDSVRGSLNEIRSVRAEIESLKNIYVDFPEGFEGDFEEFCRIMLEKRSQILLHIEGLRTNLKSQFANISDMPFNLLQLEGQCKFLLDDCEKYITLTKLHSERYINAKISSKFASATELLVHREYGAEFVNLDKLHGLRKWTKRRLLAMFWGVSTARLRYLILGMAVPATLTGLAISHFVGKYYFSIFPSLLVWWLRNYGIVKA